ncbi:hypothetical protein CYY_009417 [Polysphondylium violaceum]|uniref:IPT/TIG domain-containing protein n=1 Tax=Polysphondylium violaceum TaxID=133409 RepID=A0A8J4PLG9_9MYCE|nr:hypothetical protein CYY_009417 [Polysphondylium violaceum]
MFTKLLFLFTLICCYSIQQSNASNYVISYYLGGDDRYSCLYTVVIAETYAGDGSEFKFTSNNGTQTLEQYISKRDASSAAYLNAIIQPTFRPPLIVECNGTQIMQLDSFPTCVIFPRITEAYGVFKNVSFLFDTKQGDVYDIYVDYSLNKTTHTIQHDSSGVAIPFPLFFPYNVYSHPIRYVGPRTSTVITASYANPRITSYNCTRGYALVAKAITKCMFVGDRLYQTPFIAGTKVMDSVVTLTTIQTIFAPTLPLNASITLDYNDYLDKLTRIDTGIYFQPHPAPAKSSFEFHGNNVTIQGSFLDAVQLKNITIKDDGKSSSPLACTYSYEASETVGYLETIVCLAPNFSNYKHLTIVLVPTFYPDQPIELVYEHSASSTTSLSSLQISTFLLLLLSIMHFM